MSLVLGGARLAMNTLTKPRRFPNPFVPSLGERVDGKVVVVTGSSSGIGRSLAVRVAGAGATVVVVARREDRLNELVQEIKESGGTAYAIAADLSTADGIDAVADVVLSQFGPPDVLINNAGRSIMRSVAASEHRLHDYERTMRINYLAAVGLTLRLLPGMRERKSGHVVHSSSIGVLANLPRFSAYIGSKAAADAVLRVAEVECRSDGIKFTNVHIPLVATEMASNDEWDRWAQLTVDEAVEFMVGAIRRRPRQLDNPVGSLYSAAYAAVPGTMDRIQNAFHRSKPEISD